MHNAKRSSRFEAGSETHPSTIIVEDPRGSKLIAKLERTWHMLRSINSAIPPVVMTLYPLPMRRPRQNNGVLHGHFSGASWLPPSGTGVSHEVGINPNLFGNAEEVLGTLLHEAVHAALHSELGNRDYRYHPARFRDLCTEWRYGFSVTRWPKDGPPNTNAC